MKKFTSNKDFNSVIKRLCKDGWVFKKGKRHGKMHSPLGDLIIVPSSPGDRHALKNFKRDVRAKSRMLEV